MTHTSGKFVWTSKSLHFRLDCSLGTLNFLVSCVSGRAETRHITMSKGYGLKKGFEARTQKCKASPLHIKLGLMKNFVKAMDRNGTAFLYLRQKFPFLNNAKLREGV